MSDSAALSVLVLAWDEAAPAIRTAVAAAPVVGSLLVLLPPQPVAPTTPAAEAATSPAATPVFAASELATPVAIPAAPAEVATPATAETAPTQPPADAATAPRAAAPAEAAAKTLLAPSLSPAPGPLATRPPAVRLLYLADNPPALLVRATSFQVPAAPYLGATPAAPASAALLASEAAGPVSLPAPAAVADEAASTSDLFPSVATEPAQPLGPAAATEQPALAGAPAASPAEAPAAPTEPAAEASVEALPDDAVPPLADAAFRADEILDPDPAQELHPELAANPPAPTQADSPVLLDQPLAPAGPFGLRIPERQPALPELISRPVRPPEPDEELLPDEPAPAAPLYSAPDLNTQVIRYARQAVPVALAEGPFEAIYAPAWPTWLAALELRQRSGCPLVLHLTALAAGRQPADTAAGWPAEIQRQALRQADLVLVETYSLARRLRRELGLANTAVRVVPGGDAAAIARALRRARRA